MLQYIISRNKFAASQILNLPLEAIAEVVEYANSYYVKVKKGFGKSGTFISKLKMIEAKKENTLVYWMRDFVKANATKIQIGTRLGGAVHTWNLNYANLELAIYEYRKGLRLQNNRDEVVIGYWHEYGYTTIDSFVPQFEVV